MCQNARWFRSMYIEYKQFIFSLIVAYYSGMPEFMRKHSMLTVAQTMQNIWHLMVGKSSLQEIATLAIIQEKTDSDLETGRYGPKSGVSWIMQESWQHCDTTVMTAGCISIHNHQLFCFLKSFVLARYFLVVFITIFLVYAQVWYPSISYITWKTY